MNNELEPLWEVFPEYEWFSMGFRMGGGEDYRCEWHDWYLVLSKAEQKKYQDRWPEPDDRGWPGFYAELNEIKL